MPDTVKPAYVCHRCRQFQTSKRGSHKTAIHGGRICYGCWEAYRHSLLKSGTFVPYHAKVEHAIIKERMVPNIISTPAPVNTGLLGRLRTIFNKRGIT